MTAQLLLLKGCNQIGGLDIECERHVRAYVIEHTSDADEEQRNLNQHGQSEDRQRPIQR